MASCEQALDSSGETGLESIEPLAVPDTVEDRLTRELRGLVLDGRFMPGMRLTYRQLAERFGVSMTPVRMALRVLSQEGLVAARRGGGVVVTPLSIEDVEEIFARRVGLEALLALRGAPRLTDAELGLMKQRRKVIVDAVGEGDLDRYLAALWPYRSVCYEAAERPDILDEVKTLYQRGRRYYGLAVYEPDRFREAREILDSFDRACRERDGEKAQDVIRYMCDWASSYLAERLAAVLHRSEPDEGRKGEPDEGRKGWSGRRYG